MRLNWIVGCFAVALMMQAPLAHADDAPPEVVAKAVGAGWVFTDAKGMTLYTYAKDKPGRSVCQGECAVAWPPILATAAVAKSTSSDWSTIDRGDGKQQIAFKEMPLYSYARDSAPGTTFGDGAAGAWRPAGQDMETPPDISIGRTLDGRVLMNARGRTLYVNDDDKPQFEKTTDRSVKPGAGTVVKLASACTTKCLEHWKPLAAPSVAVANGDWSIVTREDGVRQWAFQRKPLYAPVADFKPADRREDRGWKIAIVQLPAPTPTWVTYQPSDGGEVLADAKGFTIYALSTEQTVGKVQDWKSASACDADCIKSFWRPVVASGDAKPAGNWTVMNGADGVKQWAYKGELLFTHTRDTAPGEIAGSRFLTRAWHTITRSGQEMEGMDKR